MNDTKLEVLAGHYSDTFAFIQATLKKRDRLFAGVLLILFVMLFQLYAPSESSTFISKLVAEKLGADEGINFIYIQSTVWFVLLAASVKYFQAVILVERQYNYIHSLEMTLSADYGGESFTREGASYLAEYPLFLHWTSFLYTVLFPTILVLISGAKIFFEFKVFGCSEFLIWFNALIFLFLLVSIGLYLKVIHFKKESEETRGSGDAAGGPAPPRR